MAISSEPVSKSSGLALTLSFWTDYNRRLSRWSI
jgi:hypothetical protein